MIAARLRRPYRITVSAGICDTSVSEDASQLINLADGALYWSKAHGRNQCWIYDPAVIDELSAQQRAERLERSQAMLGLRALARAIDAKDPATRRHSERVSDLVGRLALIAGWSPERARLLSEAALVHDVGKIGIPDNVLLKPGPLTDLEREQMRNHAELAARIVEDVLVPGAGRVDPHPPRAPRREGLSARPARPRDSRRRGPAGGGRLVGRDDDQPPLQPPEADRRGAQRVHLARRAPVHRGGRNRARAAAQ